MASSRMLLRVAQIARMRICGVKDVAIARALNMSQGGLARIIRTTDYQEYEAALMAGHLSKMDEKMAANRELMWKLHKVAVPLAQRRIIEVAMQNRDLKSALAASKEILDRDPERSLIAAHDQLRKPDVDAEGGLPVSLFEAIAKDADGVSASVKTKLGKLEVPDA